MALCQPYFSANYPFISFPFLLFQAGELFTTDAVGLITMQPSVINSHEAQVRIKMISIFYYCVRILSISQFSALKLCLTSLNKTERPHILRIDSRVHFPHLQKRQIHAAAVDTASCSSHLFSCHNPASGLWQSLREKQTWTLPLEPSITWLYSPQIRVVWWTSPSQ